MVTFTGVEVEGPIAGSRTSAGPYTAVEVEGATTGTRSSAGPYTAVEVPGPRVTLLFSPEVMGTMTVRSTERLARIPVYADLSFPPKVPTTRAETRYPSGVMRLLELDEADETALRSWSGGQAYAIEADYFREYSRAVTWNADDWAEATTDSARIVDGSVEIDGVRYDLDDDTAGEAPTDPWVADAFTPTVKDDRQYSDPHSMKFDGSTSGPSSGSTLVLTHTEGVPAEQYDTFSFVYQETQINNQTVVRILDSSGNAIGAAGTGNPQVRYNSASGDGNTLTESVSPEYDRWRRFTFTLDWANSTFDLLWEDVTGDTNDQEATGEGFVGSATDLARIEVIQDDGGGWNGGTSLDTWLDSFDMSYESGSVATKTKTVENPMRPNLFGLDYALNGGGVSIEVTGSPGTTDEELVTRELTGETFYALPWSDAHTEFTVDVLLSGSGGSPTVSEVNLGIESDTPPSPSNVATESVGGNTATVSFDGVTEAEGYNVYVVEK